LMMKLRARGCVVTVPSSMPAYLKG
jgi:hypothetical protein